MIPRLGTRRFGRPYHFHAACGSTNDEAARAARSEQPEGLVVVADEQTGGRGRLGRTWHSPPGTNLHLSLLLRPAGPPSALPPLTLLAGAVVARVLDGLGCQPALKWPNDVLLPTRAGPRKVAGILTEMASDREKIRHLILGIGVNVNTADFPPEIADRATSVRLAIGRPVDRGELLAAFLNELEPAYEDLLARGPPAALARWKPYAALGGRCTVEHEGGRLVGVAVGIEDDGALRLLDDHGRIHRVLAGEIV